MTASKNFRRIIRRMGEVWSSFWLVKFVSSKAYKEAAIHNEHKDRILENLHDLYKIKTNKSPDRIDEIIRYTSAERPYLIEEYQRKSDNCKMFRTTGDGRKLIWGCGWGLFVALVRENWLAVTALITLAGVLIFDVAPRLVKLIV